MMSLIQDVLLILITTLLKACASIINTESDTARVDSSHETVFGSLKMIVTDPDSESACALAFYPSSVRRHF